MKVNIFHTFLKDPLSRFLQGGKAGEGFPSPLGESQPRFCDGRVGGKRFIRNILLISILVILKSSLSIYAQADRKYIRQGNGKYSGSKFPEAEVFYRRALGDNTSSSDAGFNLGDALYRQNKFEDAAKQFEGNASISADNVKKADSFYNLGNSYLKANKFEEAIGAYKNSLKLVPDKGETKYNLAYAQDLLRQQQDQKNNQNNKDQKPEEDKKDKNQNKDKNQDQNKDQQNNNKDNQQQQDKDQKQQQQQGNISKEDAQRLLDVLANDEKNVQEKVKEAKAAKAKVRTLVNW